MFTSKVVASQNSAAADSASLEIPEWKKILIMKKRTGSEEIKHCLHRKCVPTSPDGVDGHRVRTANTCDDNNSPSGPSNKFQMSRSPKCLDLCECKFSQDVDTLPAEKVVKTIGNIKVELRSVPQHKTPVDCGDEEAVDIVAADHLTSPLSEPACVIEGHYSDEEEDLQYGPGIVDKLRARFLNLEAKSRRKPVVRKFSSLENLTGGGGGSSFRANGGFQPRIGEKRFGMRTARNLGQQRVGSNFKKAQSMETLLVSTAENNNIAANTSRRLLSARIFNSRTSNAREKSPSPVSKFSDIFRFSNKSDYVRQVSAPSINEDELPRPDTVKHFKRIFESQPQQQVEDNKTCHSVVNHGNNETSGGQTIRPASVPSSSLASRSPNGAVITIEAASPPHKDIESPTKCIFGSAKEAHPPVAVTRAVSSVVCDPPSPQSDATKVPKSPDANAVIIVSPEINRESDYLFISRKSEAAVKKDDDDDLNVVRAKATTDVPSCGDTFSEFQSSLKVTSHPSPQRESSSDEEDNNEEDLEVLGQAEQREGEEEIVKVVSVTDRRPEEVSDPPPNGEVVMVVAATTSEQRLRMGADVARAEIGGSARKPSNWQKPPPATTSIVFDFRGKDVKPNISLNPAPFGCRPAKVKKRAGSPPRSGGGDAAGPKVNGTNNHFENEDCGDDDDEEDWDEMDIGADLPTISGIVFAGENIKVGKGALLERRNKNLTIQFDDAATSTYEYPSESPSDENSQSPNDDSPNALKSSIAISSNSGLSSYTPHVLNSSESEFRLGVSRPPVLRYASSSSMPKKCESPVTAVEELIPATPEDSSGWSSTDSADILF